MKDKRKKEVKERKEEVMKLAREWRKDDLRVEQLKYRVDGLNPGGSREGIENVLGELDTAYESLARGEIVWKRVAWIAGAIAIAIFVGLATWTRWGEKETEKAPHPPKPAGTESTVQPGQAVGGGQPAEMTAPGGGRPPQSQPDQRSGPRGSSAKRPDKPEEKNGDQERDMQGGKEASTPPKPEKTKKPAPSSSSPATKPPNPGDDHDDQSPPPVSLSC